MSYWVVMLFDTESENRIRSLWKNVVDSGVNSFMLDTDSVPHITLASCDQIAGDVFYPRLKEFAAQTQPFSLVLSSIGIFASGSHVLYLAPVITDKLLDIHTSIHKLLCEKTCSAANVHYQPNHWTPHCTLAVNMPLEECIKGTASLLPEFQPIEVTVEALQVVEAYPIRYLERYPLLGREKTQ